MARIANAIARVASNTTKEPDCGTTYNSASSPIMTITIFIFWLTIALCSISPEQTGRLDREDQNHRRVEGEIGNFGKQRFAEIIGEADCERADRGAAQAAHAADDDHREGQRQHFEIEAGIDAEKGAAD